MSEEMAMVVYVLLLLRRKKKTHMVHIFFTAQFANKNNEENNEGNKEQIQTQGENTFCFSQHSQGQDDNVDTFAAVGFI